MVLTRCSAKPWFYITKIHTHTHNRESLNPSFIASIVACSSVNQTTASVLEAADASACTTATEAYETTIASLDTATSGLLESIVAAAAEAAGTNAAATALTVFNTAVEDLSYCTCTVSGAFALVASMFTLGFALLFSV